MEKHTSSILPESALQWAVNAVDPQASVIAVDPLIGSTSSALYGIALHSAAGDREVVLRLFNNAEWLREEPELARHEADSLRCAARTGLPVPKLVAYDETGEHGGLPAVLMTKLTGSVVLRPARLEGWLDELARTLVRIHAVEAADMSWTYFTYQDIPSLEVPAWSPHQREWAEVIGMVKGPRPGFKPCFIHRDYHAANVLWSGGAISGVVDWVNGCRGPAGIDVGHCRVDLAQLHGPEAADAFLEAYLRHAGEAFHYDPYWDMLSLIDILFGTPTVYAGWPAFGVTDLTDELIMKRLDAYMLGLLKRASRP